MVHRRLMMSGGVVLQQDKAQTRTVTNSQDNWGSSTKLTLDFARLSLISLREGHYSKRISARVSPNAIQCLNIAG